jgi:peptidylprolyl isomerase
MFFKLSRAYALTLALLIPAFCFSSPNISTASAAENTLILDTNKGKITIELMPDVAPKHAERMRQLAKDKFYDGVVFHRVIDGFMAQTGDPTGTGTGGSDYPDLPAEFSSVPFERGIVGMARSSSPNSANSQFFIMFDRASSLDGQYTVIGKVTSGMDIVDQIKRGDGPSGMVSNPDKITTVRLASEAQ